MNDDDLDLRLQDWQPELPDDQNFRREVWGAIEREPNFGVDFKSWLTNTTDLLNRPKVGIPITVVVLFFAAFLAVKNGQSINRQVNQEMATIYHKTINPLKHHLE